MKYYQHLCVLIVSILENNKNERFTFHVMTDHDDPEADKIKGLAAIYPNFDIRFVVMEDSYFENFPLPLKHITVQMYYRFLIPFLLPEQETALYFDCDMVCNANLRELWKIPLDGHYVAGVRDNLCSKKSYLQSMQLPLNGSYVNSGMLLMNLQMIRNDNRIPELLDWVASHPETRFPDQDAINAVFAGKIRVLGPKWNIQTGYPSKLQHGIIHYTSEKKPWLTDVYCLHHAASLYFQYLNLTPYRDYIALYHQNRNRKTQVIGCLKEVIKFPEQLVRKYVVKPLKKALKKAS